MADGGGLNRGSSSLLEPIDKSTIVEKIELDAIRLDKFIKIIGGDQDDLALWIDVEGAGYDVLESIGDLKKIFLCCILRLKSYLSGLVRN